MLDGARSQCSQRPESLWTMPLRSVLDACLLPSVLHLAQPRRKEDSSRVLHGKSASHQLITDIQFSEELTCKVDSGKGEVAPSDAYTSKNTHQSAYGRVAGIVSYSQIGDRCDSILSGITGLGDTFASTNMKTIKNTAKSIILTQTFGSFQGREKLFLKLKLNKKHDMQTIKDRHPNQSICFNAAFLEVTCPGTVQRTKRKTSTHAKARKGT